MMRAATRRSIPNASCVSCTPGLLAHPYNLRKVGSHLTLISHVSRRLGLLQDTVAHTTQASLSDL